MHERVVRESVEDGCVDILAKEHSYRPQNVVVRDVLCVPPFAYIIKHFLEDVIYNSYVKGQKKVDVVL